MYTTFSRNWKVFDFGSLSLYSATFVSILVLPRNSLLRYILIYYLLKIIYATFIVCLQNQSVRIQVHVHLQQNKRNTFDRGILRLRYTRKNGEPYHIRLRSPPPFKYYKWPYRTCRMQMVCFFCHFAAIRAKKVHKSLAESDGCNRFDIFPVAVY